MIANFDPEFVEAGASLPALRTFSSWEALPSTEYSSVTGVVCRLGMVLTADRIAALPALRFVATVTTGLDHIDMRACAAREIAVLSLRGHRQFLETIHATPEHTWGLLLGLIRHVPAACASTQRGEWERRRFIGGELAGRTLGVIGYGRVGRRLARYAEAFGMPVIFTDPDVSGGVSLDALLARADVVVMAASLLDAQQPPLLGPREFRLMKAGALLINTARGQLIDESALLEALAAGRVAGAALDVLAGETALRHPIGLAHPLIAFSAQQPERLLLTPHIAGSTHESLHRTAAFVADQIRTLS